MLNQAIRQALHHPMAVVVVCLLVAAGGVWSFRNQPIDAYPDISAQQVLIISTYPGRAPEEIERQVTVPIELAMGSVPKVSVIRSRTIFGLSIVELIFEEGVENYFARQRVQEKLGAIELPEGVTPELGPLATAYGEIYRYELQTDGPQDEMELRTLNDWVVIPRLISTPGVADVANFGGLEKQYTLQLDPVQLDRYGMTLGDIIEAVQTNNANAGGSVVRRGDMSFVIRGRGSFLNEEDIQSTVVNTRGGTPVFVRDVATVELDSRLPSGVFAKDNIKRSIEGIVLMRRGENPSQTLDRVKQKVEELNATALPEGVRIVSFYDRQYLVDSTLHTVAHSVTTGILLVLCVLLAFLGSPALSLLVVLTIPFALLFALVLMYLTDIPIGLLSLGTIDFGILVDGAVIVADNIAHRLSERDDATSETSVKATIYRAVTEVERPVVFSMLMIIAAYFPLLSLTSIEGLLFRPMALTVIFALLGAAIFAMLALPALATMLLRKGFRDWENPVLRVVRSLYGHFVVALLRFRWGVLLGMIATLVLVCVTIIPRLGFDFLPYLDEGVIWVRANFPEGTSLEQTAKFGDQMREIVHEFQDVTFVTAQAGRNDSGTDPFAPSRLEMMVGLKPYDQWALGSKRELIDKLGERLRQDFPTTRFNFTQPIIDSVTEDTNGTSANLAVEFSGPDIDILRKLGRQTIEVLRQVPGAVDVNIEQEGPQPQLVIEPDRARCARYNVHIGDVNQLINTALGGEPIGTLYEGERRFDIVTRFGREFLSSTEAIGRLPVYNQSGLPIPLEQVANFDLRDGQTFIARESGRRRITVRCDIVGRDQGGFVAEAKRLFAENVTVPEGYRVRWIGMFENLERASRHFLLVIPITVGIIYFLLLATFKTQRETLIVLLSIPFAFVGGAIALYARGMTFNVSSGVGFAALFGVSIMNGVIMVEWISKLRREGAELDEAIVSGAKNRLRPILMASLVAILGLLPASISTGLGSDVQRPLATVIVWGLFSSLLLTLCVLPALYRLLPPKIEQIVPSDAHG